MKARRTILFTGFPGFIGLRLLPRLLELKPEARIACLVQEKFLPAAKEGVAAIEKKHRDASGRIDLVTGDQGFTIVSDGVAPPGNPVGSKRIGITRAADHPST